MKRAITWSVLAFIACTALGLSLLAAFLVTLTATVCGSVGYKIGRKTAR